MSLQSKEVFKHISEAKIVKCVRFLVKHFNFRLIFLPLNRYVNSPDAPISIDQPPLQ